MKTDSCKRKFVGCLSTIYEKMDKLSFASWWSTKSSQLGKYLEEPRDVLPKFDEYK